MKNKNISLENNWIKFLQVIIILMILSNLMIYFIYFINTNFKEDPYFKYNTLKDEIMDNNILALKKQIFFYSNITNMINLEFKKLNKIDSMTTNTSNILLNNNNNSYCINNFNFSSNCLLNTNIVNSLNNKENFPNYINNNYYLYNKDGIFLNVNSTNNTSTNNNTNSTDILNVLKFSLINSILKPINDLLLYSFVKNNKIIDNFLSITEINKTNDIYYLVINYPYSSNYTFDKAFFKSKIRLNKKKQLYLKNTTDLSMEFEQIEDIINYKTYTNFKLNFSETITKINKDDLFNNTKYFYFLTDLNKSNDTGILFFNNSVPLNYLIYKKDFTKTFFKNYTINFNSLILGITQTFTVTDIYDRENNLIFIINLLLDWLSYVILYLYVLINIIKLLRNFHKSVYNLILGNLNLLRFKLKNITMVLLNKKEGEKFINKNDFIFENDNEIKEFVDEFIDLMNNNEFWNDFSFKTYENKLVIESFKKKIIINKYNENFWNNIKNKIIFENDNSKIKN